MTPTGYPGPILTDDSNPFAAHTMRVRVPAIMQQTLDANPALGGAERANLEALRDEIAAGGAIRPLTDAGTDEARDWERAYSARAGQRWHATDWFFAETFAYRRLIEAVRYFEARIDPFLPIKQHEYASEAHQALLDAALDVTGPRESVLSALILKDLWGNRVDLSYAESRTHRSATDDDLLIDDRGAVIDRLSRSSGDVHVVADNAGSELTLDLVLIDALLRDGWADRVVLHAKFHPTFVSDATSEDVLQFLRDCAGGRYGDSPRELAARLGTAAEAGRFVIQADPYWNSALLWWQMPGRLLGTLRTASLVIVKGDANYRRVLGDAYWPAETPFAQVVASVGIPLACIRTGKSDPIVGLRPGLAGALDAVEPRWRWSGRRGLIQAWFP